MKRAVVFFLLLTLFCVFNAYALDSKIVDLRDQVLGQAQEIRGLMTPKTKDSVVLTAMFDSCILTATQLDAYFSMLGIFETLTKKDSGESAIKFITAWLGTVKNSNKLGISNLDAFKPAEKKIKEQVKKLKDSFVALDGLIDVELRKFSALSISARQPKN
ncbi:MAG: hypothetical protein WC532_08030 [Candidatus Omnitrophota bacterium]